MGFIEILSLPLLALTWISGIVIMAWIVYRRSPSEKHADEAAQRAEAIKTAAPPTGPLTAVQRTALSRRRRLAK